VLTDSTPGNDREVEEVFMTPDLFGVDPVLAKPVPVKRRVFIGITDGVSDPFVNQRIKVTTFHRFNRF
jgi:hypothetical protein